MKLPDIYYSAKAAFKKGSSKPATGDKQIAITDVRDKWFNYPSNNLTPTTLNSYLQEADTGYIWQAMELYQEIEKKDLQIQSCMQIRKLAIVGKEWEIKPASDDKTHMLHKEYIEETFDLIPNFDIYLLSLTEAIGLGFAVNEVMWDVINGKVRVVEMIEVNQMNFSFYDNVKVLTVPRLLTDNNQYDGIELEDKKFVYHRHIPKGRHISRTGLLRTLSWFYLFKNYNIKDWAVFNELYGMPIRVGKYGKGAGETEKEALKDALSDIGSDAAAVISEDTLIEFVESKVKGTTNTYKSLADYVDASIAKSVLGQTASTEGTPGKLGNEKLRGQVRQDILEFDCKRIESTNNDQLIKWIIDYQFGIQEKYPKLKILCETKEDLDKRAARDEKVKRTAPRLVIPDSYYYDTYGYPEPDEKEIKKQEEEKKAAEEAQKLEEGKKKVFTDNFALKGEIELIPTQLEEDIKSLNKTIAELSQKLSKKEMAAIMARIGEKITAFEGELKQKVIKKVKKDIKSLLTTDKKEKEVLTSLTKFFGKKEFQAEGLRQMEPAARARLYTRNELKNVYQDTYHETVKQAFPGEELYAFASGPNDARTADDTTAVEMLTNPSLGGVPMPYPDVYLDDPTVIASKRPNDRNSDIIQPLFMFDPDTQKRIKELYG